jgi:hypothetical protein
MFIIGPENGSHSLDSRDDGRKIEFLVRKGIYICIYIYVCITCILYMYIIYVYYICIQIYICIFLCKNEGRKTAPLVSEGL